jgi:hypothetical protein
MVRVEYALSSEAQFLYLPVLNSRKSNVDFDVTRDVPMGAEPPQDLGFSIAMPGLRQLDHKPTTLTVWMRCPSVEVEQLDSCRSRASTVVAGRPYHRPTIRHHVDDGGRQLLAVLAKFQGRSKQPENR